MWTLNIISYLVTVVHRFVRCAEGDTRVSRGADQLAVRGHGLYIRDCIADWDSNHVARLQRHHHATFSLDHRAHRAGSVICCQHTIERVWPATSLQVAQHHATGFLAGKRFQFPLTVGADSAQPRRVEWVALVLVNQVMVESNCRDP